MAGFVGSGQRYELLGLNLFHGVQSVTVTFLLDAPIVPPLAAGAPLDRSLLIWLKSGIYFTKSEMSMGLSGNLP